MNTQQTTPLSLTFKYWSDNSNNTTVIPCECDGYNDLKKTANRLLEERPDLDHLEIYMGKLQVACWHRTSIN